MVTTIYFGDGLLYPRGDTQKWPPRGPGPRSMNWTQPAPIIGKLRRDSSCPGYVRRSSTSDVSSSLPPSVFYGLRLFSKRTVLERRALLCGLNTRPPQNSLVERFSRLKMTPFASV